MRYLSWREFNLCINFIYLSTKDQIISGVYGIPRGGLCLAVTLSHILQKPFLKEPKSGSLIVDDVYESGQTLKAYREIPQTQTFVWISKKEPIWWNAFEVVSADEWIVFPWENVSQAERDQQKYIQSRNSLL